MSGGANWEHSWVLRLKQSQDMSVLKYSWFEEGWIDYMISINILGQKEGVVTLLGVLCYLMGVVNSPVLRSWKLKHTLITLWFSNPTNQRDAGGNWIIVIIVIVCSLSPKGASGSPVTRAEKMQVKGMERGKMKSYTERHRKEWRGKGWEGKQAADSDVLEDVKDRGMGSPVKKCAD